MKRQTALPELLAPAGDFSALVAAVAGGADAVYIGGKSFSARAFAKNFDMPDIRRAVRYCHIHNVKLYVALNTLVFDRELTDAVKYAAELYSVGVDALICADLGAIREIRRAIPELEIHASTQMSIHNSLGADEAARLGISRVVLARELSLSDIKATVDNCIPECEIFLHGALCVCHSGQCLFSSLVGGRSGNRGECAQPCRLPYNGGYPLSLRDLSLAEYIPELIESGVASLKIEGRMKSAEYVYGVTSIYRRLLDEKRRATPEECAELARIFSRGGFTDGYLTGNIQAPMTGVRSELDKESSRELVSFSSEEQRASVSAEIKIKRGEQSRLRLFCGERFAEVSGDVPTEAISAPLTEAGVKSRLCKMGATSLALKPEDIVCEIDSGLNLSPASINALRREAAELIESCDRDFKLPEDFSIKARPVPRCHALRTAQVFNPQSFLEYSKKYGNTFFDIAFLPLFGNIPKEESIKNIGVYLPPIITECELVSVKKRLAEVKNDGIMYTLVGNIGHFSLAKEYGLVPVGDMRLNITNSSTRAFYRSLGAENTVLSPEITLPMARDIGGGEIIYGRIPLMLTERCFIKESFGCDKCGTARLTDRQGAHFPMMREWEHRNIIFNSVKTYMLDKPAELERQGILHIHFIFSDETPEQIAEAVRSYKLSSPSPDKSIRRIGSLTAVKKDAADGREAERQQSKKLIPKKASPKKHTADKKPPQSGSFDKTKFKSQKSKRRT